MGHVMSVIWRMISELLRWETSFIVSTAGVLKVGRKPTAEPLRLGCLHARGQTHYTERVCDPTGLLHTCCIETVNSIPGVRNNIQVQTTLLHALGWICSRAAFLLKPQAPTVHISSVNPLNYGWQGRKLAWQGAATCSSQLVISVYRWLWKYWVEGRTDSLCQKWP